ncbi:MAG: glycosyltransferase family 4 protein [Patescibacteria group bacterium]|nr:glycosyltransferase family 4 protein [Patescibacteria group bacterium]
MKIGHVCTEYKPIKGGAETYLANLCKILAEYGCTQTVYQFNSGVQEKGLTLIPHAFKVLKGGRALDLWWFNLALLTKFVRLKSEDLVICHYAFHSLPLWWKKKVIVLSHGCEWDIPPTSLSQKLKIAIAKHSFTHFKYLVANDTNYFRQMGIDVKPKTKMFEEVLPGKWFIPNCVDTEYFKPADPVSDFPQHSILVPRNISRPRGIHLAIQAFAKFHVDFPETNLVIVGDFFDLNYKQELFKLINQEKLKEKVFFKGSIDWKKMPQVYSASEMTIIPTLQREGTSLAALESMSCGIATVSTNAQGLVDLPTDQSDPNSEDLSNVMKKTYQNRNVVSKKQQQKVKDIYNLENWKNAWLKVVKEAQKC